MNELFTKLGLNYKKAFYGAGDNKSYRGFQEGVVVNLVIGIVGATVAKVVFSFILHPFVGTLLAFITVTASIIYFGRMGLYPNEVGYKGVGLWLGKRIPDVLYSEGLTWNWPWPFGGVLSVDMRRKPMDIPLSEVVTADNVKVPVDATLLYRINDPHTYLDAKDPETSLKNEAVSDIRQCVQRYPSDVVALEKKSIADAVKSGKGEDKSPLENVILGAIKLSPNLGFEIEDVQVQHIGVPDEISRAQTEIKVREARLQQEQADARAEEVAIDNLAARVKKLKDAGVDPNVALDGVQAEFGKITRISLGGNAKPIENAAAIHAGILNTAAKNAPQPSSADPDASAKGQQRKGKRKE